jgi:hypothetical protein
VHQSNQLIYDLVWLILEMEKKETSDEVRKIKEDPLCYKKVKNIVDNDGLDILKWVGKHMVNMKEKK